VQEIDARSDSGCEEIQILRKFLSRCEFRGLPHEAYE